MAGARRLLERMRRGEALAVPGAHDALSARLAERAGAQAVFVSGFGLSASLLGEPDLGFIGGSEVLGAAERVAGATKVPVFVDADTGYGDVFHVERLVEGLVARGAAGCFLEDQEWPKRCGHMRSKRLVSAGEYVRKLRAAIGARGDRDFAVVARTDARAVLGLDEALARARRYAEEGADAVFVEAPESLDELRRVRAALPSDVVLVANMVEGGKTPLFTVDELAEEGFAFALFPVSGLLAAARAMERAFAAIASEGTTASVRGEMRSFDEINEITGLPARYAREEEWRS